MPSTDWPDVVLHVVSGKGGTGKAKTNPISAELTDLFPLYARDTKGAVTVVTMSPVDQGPGITGDSTYTVPVSFLFRADTN